MSASDTDAVAFDFPTSSPDSFSSDDMEEDRPMTLGMFGVLFFLDVCFIATYYVVRSPSLY